MKKLVALLLAMLLVLAMVPAMAEDHEEVTLTFGSIWSSESEATRAPFLKTLEEFEAEYPWIHVEVDWNEANAWKDKGDALATQNAMPDVFYWNAGGILKEKVDMGQILPLNDYLDDDTKGRLMDGALANMTFDGQIYGLPYTNACSVLYINKKLFDDNGIKIPETWEEVKAAVVAFRELGITPMITGGGDRWPTCMLGDILLLRFAGDEVYRKAVFKQEGGTFKDEGLIAGANAFAELVELGAFPDDVTALTRDESEVPWHNGEIPMYVMGQWEAGNLAALENAEDFIAVPFPAVEGLDTANAFMGGPAEQFCVAAYTEHPEEAYLLCQFCAEHLSKNGYLSGAGLPCWKVELTEEEEANIAPITRQIVEATNNASSFLLWGNTALEGEDSELIMDETLLLLGGDIDGETFCDDMESIFE